MPTFIPSLNKALSLSSFLIRPLGLWTQAFQLGVLITFVHILSILIIIVKSCNVCVFDF